MRFLKALCFLLAGFFVFLIALAQLSCPVLIGTQCSMGGGDIWMLPFFYAPIGIPAVIASIVILIVRAIRRRAFYKGRSDHLPR